MPQSILLLPFSLYGIRGSWRAAAAGLPPDLVGWTGRTAWYVVLLYPTSTFSVNVSFPLINGCLCLAWNLQGPALSSPLGPERNRTWSQPAVMAQGWGSSSGHSLATLNPFQTEATGEIRTDSGTRVFPVLASGIGEECMLLSKPSCLCSPLEIEGGAVESDLCFPCKVS